MEPLQLPVHTTQLIHQLGGEAHDDGKRKCDVLKHEDGTVLKALVGTEKSKSEHSFYEKVGSSSDEDPLLQELSVLVPKYYGICNILDVSYLKLEDVANNFKIPCNMDVKIGVITYDPNATVEKRDYEISKFPEAKKLGFRVVGMRVFDEVTQKFACTGKSHGKKQTVETILDTLHLYLNKDNSCWASIVLSLFLHRLKQIESWFLKQKIYAFYASSVLFFYEGDRLKLRCSTEAIIKCFLNEVAKDCAFDTFCDKSCLKNCMHCLLETKQSFNNSRCNVCHLDVKLCREICLSGSFADVHMIDFAHVFPSTETDKNYLFGLQKLMHYIKKLQLQILSQCCKN